MTRHGRYWTCQRQSKGEKCATRNPARRRKCAACGKSRPARRKPAHAAALQVTYADWCQRYGERCGICGATRKTRSLDRDHWHTGPLAGQPRGLLCHRCNRALPAWMDATWLRNAAAYLDRAQEVMP